MVTISNSELDQAVRLLGRLITTTTGRDTRSFETRRLATNLMHKLEKRKTIARQNNNG